MLSTGVPRAFRGNLLARIRTYRRTTRVLASIISDLGNWRATPDAIASLFGMPDMG